MTVTNMADSEMSDRATPNFLSMPHVPVTSQEGSHDAPRVNNNNGMNDRQPSQDQSALEKLSATVNLLAEKVSKLEEKICPSDETPALAPRQGMTSDHCPCPPVSDSVTNVTSTTTATPTVPYHSYLDHVEVTNRPSPPVHPGSFSLATAMSNMGNNSYNSEMMNQNSPMSMAMPAAVTMPLIMSTPFNGGRHIVLLRLASASASASALALASSLTLRHPLLDFFLGAPKYDPSYTEISFSTGDLDLQGQGQACRGHHLKNHLN